MTTDNDPWRQTDLRCYLKEYNRLIDPEIRPVDGGWAVFRSYTDQESVTEVFSSLEAAKAAYLVML